MKYIATVASPAPVFPVYDEESVSSARWPRLLSQVSLSLSFLSHVEGQCMVRFEIPDSREISRIFISLAYLGMVPTEGVQPCQRS